MSRPVQAVFFGSGAFAVPILEALATAPEVSIAAVVTATPRRAGRGGVIARTPVAMCASALGVPLDVDGSAPAAVDLIVLADYGRLLPARLVESPAHGALNLHPSLLPRWRGATPVARVIAAGDARTGVSLMRMDAGLDTGPLVAQVETPIAPDETTPRLEARLARLAAELLRDRLGPWLRGEVQARPQAAAGVTAARPFRRDDGRLESHRPGADLERQVRAFQPWPGSFLETAAGRLVLWQVSLAGPGREPATAPGTFVPTGEGLGLVVGDGTLTLDEVQLAGRRRMSGADLRRGHPGLVGTVAGAGVR